MWNSSGPLQPGGQGRHAHASSAQRRSSQGAKGAPGKPARPARPLQWQGPDGAQGRGAKRAPGSSKGVRNLRVLRYLHGRGIPMSVQATSSASANSRGQMAQRLLWQLRTMHLHQIEMQQQMAQHAKWVQVELGTLPGILMTFLTQFVSDVQSQIRMVMCFVLVMFLLR